MAQFQVSANDTVFGTYSADDEQQARDLCAQDAGYKSEADMVAQLEQPSDLVAVEISVGDTISTNFGVLTISEITAAADLLPGLDAGGYAKDADGEYTWAAKDGKLFAHPL